jgi:hypothetical protein
MQALRSLLDSQPDASMIQDRGPARNPHDRATVQPTPPREERTALPERL